MSRDTEVRAEERFPITARGYTRGELLDGTDCEIPDRYRCKQILYV